MRRNKLFDGLTGSSFLLAIVKLFSTCSGMLSTMVLSHALSLEVYGTYSQATLIVTTAQSLSALGLIDAANYFYNCTSQKNIQKRYLNTVFGIQMMIGLGVGLLILVFSKGIVAYFNNVLLLPCFLLIAFRPLFSNVNGSLQHLMVSAGKAKMIAARNAVLAAIKLIVFGLVALYTQDISHILVVWLLFDISVTAVFYRIFSKNCFSINPFRIDRSIVKEILKYCVPMGIYVMTNSLCRDVDKMLIGRMCSTDLYAIYANCATPLPFDIVSGAFLTVLFPLLTRYFGSKEYQAGQTLFRNYLRIGYFTSGIFTMATILLSREMILLLYGEKYLVGQSIFVIYTIVDLVKFANLSFVLSACGKTKRLMVSSVAALAANVVLNMICYHIFGYVGPAIATVMVTLCQTAYLMWESSRSLQSRIQQTLNLKELAIFFGELIVVGAACWMFKMIMEAASLPYIVILGTVGLLYAGNILLLNRSKIMDAIQQINALR